MIKVTKNNRLEARANGRAERVELVRTPYPFARKQLIRVTATWPVPPGPGHMFAKPRREGGVFQGDFMSVMRTAQAKWPGAQLQITTIDTKPNWAKEVKT